MFVYLSIPLLSNVFMLWNRLFGIPSTVKLIKRCTVSNTGSADSLVTMSERINCCLQRYPYLFLYRRQGCLIRGYLLFFFGKRSGCNISLVFGAAKKDDSDAVDWHCWILEQEQIKFEEPEMVKRYVPFIKYTWYEDADSLLAVLGQLYQCRGYTFLIQQACFDRTLQLS